MPERRCFANERNALRVNKQFIEEIDYHQYYHAAPIVVLNGITAGVAARAARAFSPGCPWPFDPPPYATEGVV